MNTDPIIIIDKGNTFTDLFDMDEIQLLQDTFSDVTGIASVITDPAGKPLTQFSNFSSLCHLIRSTDKGLEDCLRSDAAIGRPGHEGVRMQPCLGCGLIDGGASIMVEGNHVGNWMIGQVITEDVSEDKVLAYADEIGVNREAFERELKKIKRLSTKQFRSICNYLAANVQLLAKYAYRTKALTHEMILRNDAEKSLMQLNQNLEKVVSDRTHELEELNCELEELNAILEEEVTEREKSEALIKKLNEELEDRVVHRTEQLSVSENIYSATFNQSPIAMELYDASGKLLRVNRACITMFGVGDFDDIAGQNLFENANIDSEIKEKLLNKESAEFESDFDFSKVNYKTCHQGQRTFHWCLTPVMHHESITGFVVQIVDISERKAAVEQIIKAKEAAEESVRVQAQFLANMSHEIRTPMNGIMGFTDMALLTPYDDEQREALTIIKSSTQSLLRVVNDILDYSKIGVGKMSLQMKVFNIREVVGEVLNLFSISALHKRIQLKGIVEESVTETMNGDPIRFKQVLSNLVGNAVKFTHDGEVTVKVALSPSLGMLEICVTDTGIGIPEENLQKLFQGFYQVDGSHTRSYGGTGLGLAISKSLVELMGGDISVESRLGTGSSFIFTVKHQSDDGSSFNRKMWSDVHPITSQPTMGKRILLVEDHDVSRLLGVRLLEKMGYQVNTAVDGADAVIKTLEKPYDLIFMDINMPVMDGITATVEIRRRMTQHVPIVALTAQALERDMEMCLNRGMDDFLSKPIDLLELKYILNKYLKS